MDLLKAMVWPFVRYAVSYLATRLVAFAIFTPEEGERFVVEVGAYVTTVIVNLIFSYLEKVKQKKEVLVARASPENTPLAAIKAEAEAVDLKGNTVVPKEAA